MLHFFSIFYFRSIFFMEKLRISLKVKERMLGLRRPIWVKFRRKKVRWVKGFHFDSQNCPNHLNKEKPKCL